MSKRKNSKSASARRDRRSFTDEYKREAVRLLQKRRAEGVSTAQVGRELDVRTDQLRAWLVQFGDQPDAGAAGAQSASSDEAEIRRLRRELETLRQERDFLKKAAAFFAKESR
jgi:transposase